MGTIRLINLFSLASCLVWLLVLVCIYIKATKKNTYFLYWLIGMVFYIAYLSTSFIDMSYSIPDKTIVGIILLGLSYINVVCGTEFFVKIRGRKLLNLVFLAVIAIILIVRVMGDDYILLFFVYVGCYFIHVGLELQRTKRAHNYICGTFFLVWGVFNFICHILIRTHDVDLYLYVINRMFFCFSNAILVISFIFKRYRDFELNLGNIVRIFEASTVGLELYNASGKLIVINPICLKMFQIEREEYTLGMDLFSKYKMAERSMEEIRKGHDVSFRMEFEPNNRSMPVRHLDMRERKYLEVRISILGDNRKKPEGYFVQVHDISEHIFSSQQLEERLKLAVRSSNMYEWDWYLKSNDVYIEPGFAKSLGYEELAFNGDASTVLSSVHEEDMKRINDNLLSHFNGETETYMCEWRIRNARGQYIWHMGMGAVIERETDGTPIRMVGMVQCIENLKASEKKLEVSERRYRSLFEAMLNGYVLLEKIYDEAGEVIDYLCVEVNSIVKEILGDGSIIVGKTVNSYIKHETYWLDILNQMAHIKEKNRIEQYSRNLGKILEIVFHPLGEKQIILVIRDITNERNLENMIRQTEKLSAIGQLVGGIAHDFNNQLMAISGAISIIKTKCPDGECSKYINYIEKCSNNSASLVNRLLTFSRESECKMVPVNVHDVIRSVVEILERSIDKKIKIHTSLRAEESIIFGDESQIQNTLLNIGLNARDAMINGGKLVFRTYNCSEDCNKVYQVGQKQIVIVVSDTGIGMSQEVRKRIFEPFFTTKSIGKGTGLGLAMVFSIIQSHGGCIHVNSVVNVGTDFTVTLPVNNDGVISSHENEEALIKGVEKIMVVDDESILQELLKEMLEMLGYQVIIFEDGYHALAYYREHWKEIHLVLLDMVMPKLSGKELFEGLYNINPEIKAAFLSGYGMDQVDDTLRSRIQGFISKPINMEELSIKMREMLEG